MNPDYRKMELEEVLCPGCGSQLVVVPIAEKTNTYRFDGCRCGHEHFVLPDSIAKGLAGAPLLLFRPKSN